MYTAWIILSDIHTKCHRIEKLTSDSLFRMAHFEVP
jgi:hypothetical protein